MRGRNLKPARVYQTASKLLESGGLIQAPPWYTTIGSIPPADILTRPQPIQHHLETKLNPKIRKPSKMFKPQALVYEEDGIRRAFYSDHPWELARPRVMLENDGKDGQKCDWSRMQQVGRALTGESVVQRQLWLMNHPTNPLSKNKAYDIARKEFYALRHAEEVERRVAKEEAEWVGAYFGKSHLEVGMQLEDGSYEEWKVWAAAENAALEMARDAYTAPIEEEGLDPGVANEQLV